MSHPFDVVLLGSILGGAFSALLYGGRLWEAAQRKRVDELWRRTAQTVKGKFEISDASRTLRANVNGAELRVDEAPIGRVQFTRIRGMAAGTIGLSIDVARADAFTKAFIDVRVTDDAAFDGAFVVETRRPALARIWLDASSRAAIRAAGQWKLHLDGGSLTMVQPSSGITDASDLARAIRSAAVVAQRLTRLNGEWTTVARKLGGVVARPVSFERTELAAMTLVHEGLEVKLSLRLESAATDKPPVTVLEAPAAVKHDPATQASFEERVKALGARDLRFAEGKVVLEIEGLVTDAELLGRALALVTEAAAAPSIGPYR
jgi:hypothetical protein